MAALMLAAAALLNPSLANAGSPPDEFICPRVFVAETSAEDEDGAEFGIARPGRTIFISAVIFTELWDAGERPAFDDGCELLDLSSGGFTWDGDEPTVTLRLVRDGAIVWTDLDASFEPDALIAGSPEDFDWVVSANGEDLTADAADFQSGGAPIDYEEVEFRAAFFQFGVAFLDLRRDLQLGVITIEMEVTYSGTDTGGASTRSFFSETDLSIVRPKTAATGPGASVTCSAPVVGAAVTCDLVSDPGVAFLWQASTNPVFATGVVTTDAAGKGQFVFTVPASTLGQPVLVEIVAWTAASSIGVASGPVPTSVPSGGGPRSPLGELLVLGVVMLGAVVLVRPSNRRAGATRVG